MTIGDHLSGLRPHGACHRPAGARQAAGSVQRPSRTWASNSCRKCFSVVSTGVAAASPNAQSVLPAMCPATLEQREVLHLAFAALDLPQDLDSQSVPSRHGVHLPHDSWR